ncbi:MAG: deoxyribodipyrimidine photo-lyase [Thermoplasmatales archaeon]|nr:MAG: deoxyribodipyrimidine photo-lyase [Thermoplasmatales archaeon]
MQQGIIGNENIIIPYKRKMIQNERIKYLNDKKIRNEKYIYYWMQQSQRTEYNHALEFAINQSNKYKKPLIVYFGLTDSYPDANIRHYKFMLEGLKEVEKSLEKRGIKFLLNQISPDIGIVNFSKNASMIIVDRGYLKIQKKWRQNVAKKIKCPLIQIESDAIVPIEVASDKEEYAASTIRPKINNKLPQYLIKIKKEKYNQGFNEKEFDSLNIKDISKTKIDNIVKPITTFIGGTNQALKQLNLFLKYKINNYKENRNDPNLNFISNMSPYLHFGQVSSLQIALLVLKNKTAGNESYLDELIIRRELSMNFVHYNSEYNNYNGLPEWSKKSLKKHEIDKRKYTYSTSILENAETHDSYWNAAQKQMIKEGKMHGYMRMYWGKKIIEWTKKPISAFKIALYLNNKYELDGRDPNAYSGVAWCFGKHDRPWAERPIFGNIRYMNANGLKRKFDIEKYAKKYE